VTAISTADPAVVETSAATGWVSGNVVAFPSQSVPVLQNRRFIITVVDTTHFSLSDEITGEELDGSTFTFVSGSVSRIQELSTPYGVQTWQNVRVIQTETNAVLIGGGIPPQYLQASFPANTAQFATFTIEPGVFLDGPYLDPFTNGVRATPGGTSGNITITLSFAAYDSTLAYSKGSFVVSSSINYVSLQDNNVANTPASSPSFWAVTSAGAAINNGQG
jgi:hypothetical protein